LTNHLSPCILLVDDDETTNFIHRCLLEDLGVTGRILVTYNGREALETIQQEKVKDNYCPMLILLDLNMPVMNGFEFLEAYQQSEEAIKRAVAVVVLTTSLNPKDIDKVKDKGVAEFLNKPLAQNKLKEVLEKYFYNRN
jgi:CheY-like chemotaxis protein